jgi:hypothetical protein
VRGRDQKSFGEGLLCTIYGRARVKELEITDSTNSGLVRKIKRLSRQNLGKRMLRRARSNGCPKKQRGKDTTRYSALVVGVEREDQMVDM